MRLALLDLGDEIKAARLADTVISKASESRSQNETTRVNDR
jgi:hypothetical protein